MFLHVRTYGHMMVRSGHRPTLLGIRYRLGVIFKFAVFLLAIKQSLSIKQGSINVKRLHKISTTAWLLSINETDKDTSEPMQRLVWLLYLQLQGQMAGLQG